VRRDGGGGNVETSAHESAIDAAQEFPVEVDVGLPVDAVEVEPEMAAGRTGGATNSVRYQKSAQKNESEI